MVSKHINVFKYLHKQSTRISKKAWAIILIVVVLITCGVLFKTISSPEKPSSDSDVITVSTNNPSEIKPNKNTYKWQGAPDEPKYISLPTITAEGFVQKVGVDQNKEIAVPNNIYKAGWFVATAKPGNTGLSIIDGHVNGRVNSGIFKDLVKLKVDDTYTVELGSGVTKNYRVTKIIQVPTKDAPNALFSQEPNIKSQLNLITCGGTFNKSTKQYDERVIVYAALI